jgi:hypothetical protein
LQGGGGRVGDVKVGDEVAALVANILELQRGGGQWRLSA